MNRIFIFTFAVLNFLGIYSTASSASPIALQIDNSNEDVVRSVLEHIESKSSRAECGSTCEKDCRKSCVNR